MNIIYPTKTVYEVMDIEQQYKMAVDNADKYPKWWVRVSAMWTLFNVCAIFAAIGCTFSIMTNANSPFYDFIRPDKANNLYEFFMLIGPTGDTLFALMAIALILLIFIGISGGLRLFVEGKISPESKKTGDYAEAERKLYKLSKEYEEVERFKVRNTFADETSEMSFRIKTEINPRTGRQEKNLYITSKIDGLELDYSFGQGSYKVSTSEEDKTNTIDLSVLDKCLNDIVTGTEITVNI